MNAAVSEAAVLEALRTVRDPDLERDIVALKFIRNLTIDGGKVAFAIELATHGALYREAMREQARQAVARIPGVTAVAIEMGAQVRSTTAADPAGKAPVPGVKNIIAVGAGKGGVGKTTVAVNLAIALSQCGARVGDDRRRHLRPQRADHARHPDPAHRPTAQQDHSRRAVRHSAGLDGVPDRRRCAGHLARPDAARRDPAVLPRGALGEHRLPDRRHAAGHRRRRAQPQPDRPGRRRGRRDDAADGVAGRHPARGRGCIRSSTSRRSA